VCTNYFSYTVSELYNRTLYYYATIIYYFINADDEQRYVVYINCTLQTIRIAERIRRSEMFPWLSLRFRWNVPFIPTSRHWYVYICIRRLVHVRIGRVIQGVGLDTSPPKCLIFNQISRPNSTKLQYTYFRPITRLYRKFFLYLALVWFIITY